MRATILVLLIACGCSRGTPSSSGDAVDSSASSAPNGKPGRDDLSSMSARDLIRRGSACNNTYKCPARDELERRTEGKDHDTVLRAGLEVLLDAQVVYGSREARAALDGLAAWIRVRGPKLSAEEKDAVVADLKKVLDRGDKGYRRTLYGYIDSTGLSHPRIREFFIGEIENPARDDEDVRAAANALGAYQRDMTLATRWIRSKDFRLVRAGVHMRAYIDKVAIKKLDEDKALLAEVARMKSLPPDIALDVLEAIETYGDASLKSTVDLLKRHPDPDVAAKAQKIVL